MENSSHPPQKQCPLTLDEAVEYEKGHGRLFNDPNIDLKKVRRTVSNRLSARRSRSKMTMYTHDLGKTVKYLEGQISIHTPQVEIYKEKRKLLQLENISLENEVENRSSEAKSLEMAIEKTRGEIKRLKELEKTAHRSTLASDSKAKEIPYFDFEPCLKATPYPSINLYETCLQNYLQKNPRPSRVPKMAPDSAIEQSVAEIEPAMEVEKTTQEYEDVDQYINFDVPSAVDVADGER